MTESQ